jgi:hypothetical protein
MQMSENIADLAAALAKAQLDLEGAAKKSNNPAFRSKYADLGAVWDAWQEVGPKNGLSVAQFPTDSDDAKMVSLTTMLLHSSGQWLKGTFSLPASKQDAHGFGSAVTYLRRFSLSAIVGVCPIDDDGNASVKKGREVPVNTNPAQDEPGGADDVAAKWAAWGRAEIDKLKVSGFDREGLAAWDASNRKHFTKLQKAAPEVHDELMAVVDAMNEAFDRFHPINAG